MILVSRASYLNNLDKVYLGFVYSYKATLAITAPEKRWLILDFWFWFTKNSQIYIHYCEKVLFYYLFIRNFIKNNYKYIYKTIRP